MSLKKYGKGKGNYRAEEQKHERAEKNARARKPRTKRNRKTQFSEIRHEGDAM